VAFYVLQDICAIFYMMFYLQLIYFNKCVIGELMKDFWDVYLLKNSKTSTTTIEKFNIKKRKENYPQW